jgi:hypothetical protein
MSLHHSHAEMNGAAMLADFSCHQSPKDVFENLACWFLGSGGRPPMHRSNESLGSLIQLTEPAQRPSKIVPWPAFQISIPRLLRS